MRIIGEEKRSLDDENNPFDYWLTDTNNAFIVQSREQSKPVVANGSSFDGTMRVGFSLAKTHNTYSVKFFDAYWKLPRSPIGVGSLNDWVVSHIAGEQSSSGPQFRNRTRRMVLDQLQRILPQIHQRIVEYRCADRHG